MERIIMASGNKEKIKRGKELNYGKRMDFSRN